MVDDWARDASGRTFSDPRTAGKNPEGVIPDSSSSWESSESLERCERVHGQQNFLFYFLLSFFSLLLLLLLREFTGNLYESRKNLWHIGRILKDFAQSSRQIHCGSTGSPKNPEEYWRRIDGESPASRKNPEWFLGEEEEEEEERLRTWSLRIPEINCTEQKKKGSVEDPHRTLW